MINDNIQDNEKKELEKQKLLIQMKNEIESLERQIKYSRLSNLKINSIKNLKLTARILQLVTPYALTAGILAGVFSIAGITPFRRDKKEVYSNVMMEFDNLGNIRYEQQYNDFNKINVFKFYSKWESQEGDFYTRIVKTYNVEEKTYEELVELINKENLSLEDILGEPISIIKETKNNLTEEEINKKAFMQATIYRKDINDYIIKEETINENILLTIFYLLANVPLGAVLAFIRSQLSSFDFGECVERINDEYESVDTQELRLKLEIRRDNYNRMVD